jgi:predicted DNA-binding transcriptional regulator AlpA
MHTQLESPKRRLRTPEAAAFVGLSPSTLEKLRVTGSGPVYEKAGAKIVVYTFEELECWLAARRCHSTSDRGPKQNNKRA